jgi:hypothetical protein
MPGKANCCCPARVQHSVLCPRFRGEDGSEDLPVHFGAAGARWCGVGGQVDAAVGAEVVAAGEVLVADEIATTIRAPGLWLFGFDSLSSPLEWGRGRGPYRISVCPEVIAAAVWPPGAEVVVAAAAGPPMWGVVRTCGGGTGVPFVMAP